MIMSSDMTPQPNEPTSQQPTIRLTKEEQRQLNEVLMRGREPQRFDYDKILDEPTMRYGLEMEQQGYEF